MNLHEKIITIMSEIENINKGATVGRGNSAYKGVTNESVLRIVRNKLIEHKVVAIPFQAEHTSKTFDFKVEDQYNKGSMKQSFRNECFTQVSIKLVNAENIEEELIYGPFSGVGVDPQDKAAGKAMTYALKYSLLNIFWIPTGNDPDSVHSNDLGPDGAVKNQGGSATGNASVNRDAHIATIGELMKQAYPEDTANKAKQVASHFTNGSKTVFAYMTDAELEKTITGLRGKIEAQKSS